MFLIIMIIGSFLSFRFDLRTHSFKSTRIGYVLIDFARHLSECIFVTFMRFELSVEIFNTHNLRNLHINYFNLLIWFIFLKNQIVLFLFYIFYILLYLTYTFNFLVLRTVYLYKFNVKLSFKYFWYYTSLRWYFLTTHFFLMLYLIIYLNYLIFLKPFFFQAAFFNCCGDNKIVSWFIKFFLNIWFSFLKYNFSMLYIRFYKIFYTNFRNFLLFVCVFRYWINHYIDRLIFYKSIFISNWRTVKWRWRKRGNSPSFISKLALGNWVNSWRYWILLNHHWYFIVRFFRFPRVKFWLLYNFSKKPINYQTYDDSFVWWVLEKKFYNFYYDFIMFDWIFELNYFFF